MSNNANSQKDRIEHLLELLRLSHWYRTHWYRTPRLKELIAQEIVETKRVTPANVFMIRSDAKEYESKDILSYCNQYLRLNSSSVRMHWNGELRKRQDELNELTEDDETIVVGEAIAEVERNLQIMKEFP